MRRFISLLCIIEKPRNMGVIQTHAQPAKTPCPMVNARRHEMMTAPPPAATAVLALASHQPEACILQLLYPLQLRGISVAGATASKSRHHRRHNEQSQLSQTAQAEVSAKVALMQTKN